MDKLRADEESIQARQHEVQMELDNIPDPEQVRSSAKWAVKVMQTVIKDSPTKVLIKRDFKWKRDLVQHSFTGVDNYGKVLGVYVDYDKDGNISFEINGRFETTAKSLTLTKEELIDAFDLDPEYHDVDSELNRIKCNVVGIYRSLEHHSK